MVPDSVVRSGLWGSTQSPLTCLDTVTRCEIDIVLETHPHVRVSRGCAARASRMRRAQPLWLCCVLTSGLHNAQLPQARDCENRPGATEVQGEQKLSLVLRFPKSIQLLG